MKTTIIITCLISMFSRNTHGQRIFSAHLHIAAPTGDFGDGVGDEFDGSVAGIDPKGAAGIGLGVGAQYRYPIGDKGVHVLTSIDIVRSPIKKQWRNEFDATLNENSSMKYSSYYSIPLAVGLHYQAALNETVSVYAQGCGIFNTLKVSSAKLKSTFESGTSLYTELFKPGVSFGFGVNSGVIIKEKYLVGIGYKMLGTHAMQRTTTYSSSNNGTIIDTGTTHSRITLFTISAGIIL